MGSLGTRGHVHRGVHVGRPGADARCHRPLPLSAGSPVSVVIPGNDEVVAILGAAVPGLSWRRCCLPVPNESEIKSADRVTERIG